MIYLTSNHNMCYVRLIDSDWQDEVTRSACAFTDKKASIFGFLTQQLFRIFSTDVTMEPSEKCPKEFRKMNDEMQTSNI